MGIDNEQYCKRKEKDERGNNQSYLLGSHLESNPTQDINIEGASPFRDRQQWDRQTSVKRTNGWLGTKF